MSKNISPLEIDEQHTVVEWLDIRGVKIFSATAQDTFTSWKGIAKNKKLGVRKGVPDMIICLDEKKTKSGKRILVFIEMKRVKGGRVSEEQQTWIDFLSSVGTNVQARVCKGANEAIDFLETLILPKVEDTRPIEDQEWFNSGLNKITK